VRRNKRDEKMERRRQDPVTAANRRRPLWRPMSTQTAATGGDNSAKAVVAEQISQTVQSTSNLLHLMQNSSTAQVPFSLQFHS